MKVENNLQILLATQIALTSAIKTQLKGKRFPDDK